MQNFNSCKVTKCIEVLSCALLALLSCKHWPAAAYLPPTLSVPPSGISPLRQPMFWAQELRRVTLNTPEPASFEYERQPSSSAFHQKLADRVPPAVSLKLKRRCKQQCSPPGWRERGLWAAARPLDRLAPQGHLFDSRGEARAPAQHLLAETRAGRALRQRPGVRLQAPSRAGLRVFCPGRRTLPQKVPCWPGQLPPVPSGV